MGDNNFRDFLYYLFTETAIKQDEIVVYRDGWKINNMEAYVNTVKALKLQPTRTKHFSVVEFPRMKICVDLYHKEDVEFYNDLMNGVR